jgi:Pectate lyase superfamily protein
MVRSAIVALCLILIAGPARAQSDAVYWPADSGYANVRDFGAKGDGVTDDTEALRKAFKQPAVFLPSGTYLVRGPIEQTTSPIAIQGAGTSKTIIRLADKTYTDADKAQWVLRVRATVQDLTVEVGVGNPGAVGLAVADSVLRNVAVRSSDPAKLGRAGILLYGEGFLHHVDVDGCAVGVQSQSGNLTAEDLAVHQQNNAGLYLQSTQAAVRHLTSQQDETRAIVGNGSLCLTTAYLGGRSEAAIEWTGTVFARKVDTEAYRNVFKHDGDLVHGPAIDEYSPKFTTLLKTEKKSLDLPFEKMPVFESAEASDWVSVKSFGAKGDRVQVDDVAIQKAIDSGKPIVYFPRGVYRIAKTIELRGSLRRLVGMGSRIEGADGSKPRFRHVDGKTPNVLVEHLEIDGERCAAFEVASSRPLALRSLRVDCSLQQTIGRDPVFFLEDVKTHLCAFRKATVYARQLTVPSEPFKNSRNGIQFPAWWGADAVKIDGGSFVCLGFQTGMINVADRAEVELIGCQAAVASVDGSNLSMAGNQQTTVRETQAGHTAEDSVAGPYVGRRRQ